MKLERRSQDRFAASLAHAVMATTLLLATCASLAATDSALLIRESEQGMYAADFKRATQGLDAALAAPTLESDVRLALLLQKLRVQQNARLAGVTLGDEAATMVDVSLLAKQTRSRDLTGQAALRLAVSRYFTALLADDTERAMNFVPEFRAAAREIDAPCRRAEALFFVGLMPQIVGLVAASQADLEAAQALAKDCPLEQSYIDRHFAAVAEDAGDLAGARTFARRSSEARRQIGFRIFLPFSLLLEADLEEKSGDKSRSSAVARSRRNIETAAASRSSTRELCGGGAASNRLGALRIGSLSQEMTWRDWARSNGHPLGQVAADESLSL